MKAIISSLISFFVVFTALLLSSTAFAQTPLRKIITTPGAEVPASCTAFSGKWTGVWSQGGIGQLWLWVTEVNADCSAKVAYMRSTKIPLPQAIQAAEIKDGALAFICNKSTGGTCVFKRNGEALWASYSNPGGGTNSAVFDKIQ